MWHALICLQCACSAICALMYTLQVFLRKHHKCLADLSSFLQTPFAISPAFLVCISKVSRHRDLRNSLSALLISLCLSGWSSRQRRVTISQGRLTFSHCGHMIVICILKLHILHITSYTSCHLRITFEVYSILQPSCSHLFEGHTSHLRTCKSHLGWNLGTCQMPGTRCGNLTLLPVTCLHLRQALFYLHYNQDPSFVIMCGHRALRHALQHPWWKYNSFSSTLAFSHKVFSPSMSVSGQLLFSIFSILPLQALSSLLRL